MNIPTVIVILAFVCCSSCLALSKKYQNSVELDSNGKAFKLYWSHNSNDPDWMHFAVEAKTTGWVGFGFTEKIGGMKNYDVINGYVLQDSTQLTDCLTNGYKIPLADNLQNYYRTASSEVNGTTTLEFKRKLDTGDSKGDLVIKPGRMIVVWSYGEFDNVNVKHVARGYQELVLLSGVSSIAHAASWVLPLLSLLTVCFFI